MKDKRAADIVAGRLAGITVPEGKSLRNLGRKPGSYGTERLGITADAESRPPAEGHKPSPLPGKSPFAPPAPTRSRPQADPIRADMLTQPAPVVTAAETKPEPTGIPGALWARLWSREHPRRSWAILGCGSSVAVLVVASIAWWGFRSAAGPEVASGACDPAAGAPAPPSTQVVAEKPPGEAEQRVARAAVAVRADARKPGGSSTVPRPHEFRPPVEANLVSVTILTDRTTGEACANAEGATWREITLPTVPRNPPNATEPRPEPNECPKPMAVQYKQDGLESATGSASGAERTAPLLAVSRPSGERATPPPTAQSRPAAETPARRYTSCPPGLRLNGVLRRPGGGIADINGRAVAIGQTVNGAKLLAIREFGVEMELKGEYFILGFSSGPEEPASPREQPEPSDDRPRKAGSADTQPSAQSRPAEGGP